MVQQHKKSSFKSMERHEFGKYIASIRNKSGLNRPEWAAKIGITDYQLRALEFGLIEKPDIETISKIAAGFNLEENHVNAVYYGIQDEKKLKERARLDNILAAIKKDNKFALKNYAARSFSEKEDIPQKTKIFIIKMYEKITGNKLL